MLGRNLRGNGRGAAALYLILAVLLLIVLVVVFLLQPAYFIAVVALGLGAGILLVARGNPAGWVVGGILMVGGIVIAIIATLHGTLAGFSVTLGHQFWVPGWVLAFLGKG